MANDRSEDLDRYVPPERYEQLFDVLRHRRAVRGYRDKPVDRETIERLLAAARWAPSGANSQPWEVVVVTDPETIWEIGDAYVQSYDEKYQESVPHFAVDNKRWQREVPCYLIILGDRRIRSAYPSADIPGEERANVQTYQHSLGNFIYSIWLAAATMGLATTETTCYSDHAARIRELLEVPESFDIIAALPLGYPHRYQRTRYRREVSEFVHWESYDQSKFRSDEEIDVWLERVVRSRYRGDGELLSDADLSRADDIRSE